MIIMKFGGTSVGSADSIRQVRKVVLSQIADEPVVVVSAVSGVTNLLVDISQQNKDRKNDLLRRHTDLIAELWENTPEDLVSYIHTKVNQVIEQSKTLSGGERSDILLSLGEQLSAAIICEFISDLYPARQYIATDLFVTNDGFGAAEIKNAPTVDRISRFKEQINIYNHVPVVTGFIGSTENGQVTTLGRGGSDYSATLLGHYLEAEEIQIWTDVDGVFTTDPRKNSQAELIPEITYQEASELAAFGAKVLHPKTMRPAFHSRIPIRIANTFNPDAETTRIVASSDRQGEVVAIASKQSVMMVNMYAAEMVLSRGFLERISSIFARHSISIDIISASETSVSVTLDNHEQLEAALDELRSFSEVTVNDGVGLVSLIGQSISCKPALLGSICNRLADMHVELAMVSVGALGINISLVLPTKDVDRVTEKLHTYCIGGEL